MTTVEEQYAPGTRVRGNYLGEAPYTGVVTKVYPHHSRSFVTCVQVTLGEPITVFDVVRTEVCEFVDASGEPTDGSTLSVVA